MPCRMTHKPPRRAGCLACPCLPAAPRGPEDPVSRGWRKAGAGEQAPAELDRAAQRGGLGGRPCLRVNDCFCLFRVLSCSPQLLGLSPPPLEGQDSQMTPLKVNRTLPLCLRRNLPSAQPKPPSGQYASFSRSHLPTVAGGGGSGASLRSPAQRDHGSEPEGPPLCSGLRGSAHPCAWKHLWSFPGLARPVGPLGSVWGAPGWSSEAGG